MGGWDSPLMCIALLQAVNHVLNHARLLPIALVRWTCEIIALVRHKHKTIALKTDMSDYCPSKTQMSDYCP